MSITWKWEFATFMFIMQSTIMFIMYIRSFIRSSIANKNHPKNIDNKQVEKRHEHKSIKNPSIYVKQQS